MIVSFEQMREAEEKAFAGATTAADLMESAGRQIAGVVRDFWPRAGRCVVFFGKGHNGGDALVAARHLARVGWQIELRPAFPEQDWSDLTRQHFAALPGATPDGAGAPHPCVVLDGLLGIGVSGALREPILGAVRAINALREKGARVVAIDLPTGLNGDTGEPGADCVVADLTATIGFAKKALVADAATKVVGRLAILPLAELEATGDPMLKAAAPETLAGLFPRRSFESHKTHYGRVGIIAGGVGTVGAAVMASTAALRAGAGLITLYVPEKVYAIAATACPPEIMVRPVGDLTAILREKLDVLAVGPGLGQDAADQIRQIVVEARPPIVLDADGLNAVAGQIDLLADCAGPRLLTPHPGEMARLFPGHPVDRRRTVEEFTDRFPVVLLLKGARTVVGEHGRPISFNTTGTPGMGTGGMGDVLTGVCAALSGQGLSLYDAARIGAWLCGRAAELALSRGGASEQSLAPTDLFAQFGAAFREL